MSTYQAPVKGILAILFDMSFTSFVAPKLLKLLYASFVVLALLFLLTGVASAYSVSNGLGFLSLLVLPLLFSFLVIIFRVALEIIQVCFALEKHAAQQLMLLRSGLPPASELRMPGL